MKLRSDNKFLEFIKGKKTFAIAFLALVGAIFIFASGNVSSFPAEESADELSQLCSALDGVGECRTVINYGNDGEVLAVAVLCEGAEQIEVKSKLYKLISNLYGLGYNRISVLKISE